ncbi:MAG: hypothetical protein GX589_02825 [Deltaproteobacteria bacterium]|nr:hypothetical protein [Deltaproteobacteria bacterium]
MLVWFALLFFGFFGIGSGAEWAAAEQRASYDALKRQGNNAFSLRELHSVPVTLPNDTQVILIAPTAWRGLNHTLAELIKSEHAHFSHLLGPIPQFDLTVMLMEEEAFFKLTRAPRWTNALYFKGRITIPLAAKGELDQTNLMRAVKHEFAHAVINAFSRGRCPGWLDEGLAQWAEGPENPALRPALAQWLKSRGPVPLNLLQGGFTKLDLAMVPAAYAQSLFITKLIIRSFGFKVISKYLEELRREADQSIAFKKSFGFNEQHFERMAGLALSDWR